MATRLRPLSGLDAGFLYLEEAGTPMHVGSLMLLEVPAKRGYDFYQSLLDLLAERLPKAPALRRVLQNAPAGLGHPMWRDGGDVALEHHVLRRKLRAPGTDKQLHALVATLHAGMLPRDRPLWQFVVIEGHRSGCVALHTRVHHALLDGQGGVALAQVLLDLEARQPAKRRRGAVHHDEVEQPGIAEVASASLRAGVQQFARMFRALPETLRLAREGVADARGLVGRLRDSVLLAPRTPFNAKVGKARSFSTVSLPLADVKQISRSFGVSLNDVVMALVAHAVRQFLLAQRRLPTKPMIAAMPVSLRESGNADSNNQVSMVQVALATQVRDDVERLRSIATATGAIRQQVSTLRHLIPTDFPGLAAPIWASGLSRLWARGNIAEKLPALANLVVSNVPGPPMSLYLAGARLVHNYPVSIVTHGLGLNFTVQSYAGQMEFGIIACRDAVPDAALLSNGLRAALKRYLELSV
jgi:diacylglycerol O-acyltransferase / wax synthase